MHTGSAIISMHYPTVMRRCGSVGIPLAFGPISRGKTIMAKLAVAMCGNYPKGYTCYLSPSMARSHLSGGLPFIFDDPDNDFVIKSLLTNAFGGAEMGTQRSQFSARCTPLVTVNEYIIDQLMLQDEK